MEQIIQNPLLNPALRTFVPGQSQPPFPQLIGMRQANSMLSPANYVNDQEEKKR
jgi:hypothetical protein